MASMPGRFAVIESLRAERVRYVFGNPGTSEGPLMDALERSPDLTYVLATQEGVAMGMADGYARATGEVPFVNLHIETGLANGLSLLYNAYAGGTPVVLSAANSNLAKTSDYRTDLVGLTHPFTKWGAEITQAAQIPSIMARAFTEARTVPTGPAFVSFTPNAFDEEADLTIPPRRDVYTCIAPDTHAVDEAAVALATAQRPVMLIGDRVAQYDAVDAAVHLAEQLGARVYGAGYAEMSFPTRHPQWAGQLPPYSRLYRDQLATADVLLAVGCKVFHDFFDMPTEVLSDGATLIHMDCNVTEIGRSQPTDLGILCDLRLGLERLRGVLETRFDADQHAAAKARGEAIAVEKSLAMATALKSPVDDDGARPMAPLRMMEELARVAPADTIIVDDSVSARACLHDAFEFSRAGSMHSERGGGAIGWGMGAALGVKLGQPDRPVLAIVGDGSAMMTIQALWTASSYQIPVVYAVCNNAAYRVLKLNLHAYFDDVLGEPDRGTGYLGMDLPQGFDMAGIASAMGVAAERIEDPDRIGPALRRALDSGAPALLDVVIDGAL